METAWRLIKPAASVRKMSLRIPRRHMMSSRTFGDVRSRMAWRVCVRADTPFCLHCSMQGFCFFHGSGSPIAGCSGPIPRAKVTQSSENVSKHCRHAGVLSLYIADLYGSQCKQQVCVRHRCPAVCHWLCLGFSNCVAMDLDLQHWCAPYPQLSTVIFSASQMQVNTDQSASLSYLLLLPKRSN